jgi:DNA (cytosine-5)-methyltransferase 1
VISVVVNYVSAGNDASTKHNSGLPVLARVRLRYQCGTGFFVSGDMRELALFAGAGGGILASHLLGWRTVCAVEIDCYAAAVLAMRQNDGILPPFPIWDDVRTFDGTRWRGRVDIVSGGFPCQDISVNGKGHGLDGERSGLWSEMSNIIRDVGPQFVFVENSPALTVRGIETVLADLAAMGFNAEWGCVSAGECGADHERDRIWIVANAAVPRCQEDVPSGDEAEIALLSRIGDVFRRQRFGAAESRVCRASDGVADRVDRIKCLGNGQVPRVAATAWSILAGRSGQ